MPCSFWHSELQFESICSIWHRNEQNAFRSHVMHGYETPSSGTSPHRAHVRPSGTLDLGGRSTRPFVCLPCELEGGDSRCKFSLSSGLTQFMSSEAGEVNLLCCFFNFFLVGVGLPWLLCRGFLELYRGLRLFV